MVSYFHKTPWDTEFTIVFEGQITSEHLRYAPAYL